MFYKHFARMLTGEELSDCDAMVYYDIVPSVVATIHVPMMTKSNPVGIEVMAYTPEDEDGDMWIYENLSR